MSEQSSRRDFLKMGALAMGAAAGAGISGCGNVMSHAGTSGGAPMMEFRAKPIETVRIGFVGVGGQGTGHVRNLLKIEGAVIKAVCDIKPNRVKAVQSMVEKAGFPRPSGYDRGDWDFVRMCQEEDLDLVYTATPWRWHVPVCVSAMKNGKHAATEVPAAWKIDQCWELVETSEKYRKHCVLMENCCYDSVEMQILNMVKKGLLGDLLYAECGYLHDLRGVKFARNNEGKPVGEAEWRLAHSIKRNGNLYPTHGLGPVSQCMDINRGDRFDFIVSMSTKAVELQEYAAKRFGPDSPEAKTKYKLGDVNSTLIRTKKGCVILVGHDTDSPRPYSRKILVQGTNGIVRKYPNALIHIEGKSPGHSWEDISKYNDYRHPIWTDLGSKARGAGHGGMDFIEDYRLIQALREGRPTDTDVYDAAAWSVIGELSEISVAHRGRSVDVPDFTRGQWKTPRQWHVMDMKTIG